MCFYDNYAALCKAVGKTPSAVALELKIAKSTVTKWKNKPDAKPNGKTLTKLCVYFGVSTDALLGIEKAPTAESRERGAVIDEIVNLLQERSAQEQEAVLQLLRTSARHHGEP